MAAELGRELDPIAVLAGLADTVDRVQRILPTFGAAASSPSPVGYTAHFPAG
jgi:hypothetical protein